MGGAGCEVLVRWQGSGGVWGGGDMGGVLGGGSCLRGSILIPIFEVVVGACVGLLGAGGGVGVGQPWGAGGAGRGGGAGTRWTWRGGYSARGWGWSYGAIAGGDEGGSITSKVGVGVVSLRGGSEEWVSCIGVSYWVEGWRGGRVVAGRGHAGVFSV